MDSRIGESFIDMFVYGNCAGNVIMNNLAPAISVLFVSPMKLRKAKEKQDKKEIIRQSCTASVCAGLAFICGLLILLLLLFVYRPESSNLQLEMLGPCADLVAKSKYWYIPVFLIHMFCYGFSYSMLGNGVFLATDSIFGMYFVPIFLNQSALYILPLVPKAIKEFMIFITPDWTYDILMFVKSIWKNVFDLCFILALGIGLIMFRYLYDKQKQLKYTKNSNKKIKE